MRVWKIVARVNYLASSILWLYTTVHFLTDFYCTGHWPALHPTVQKKSLSQYFQYVLFSSIVRSMQNLYRKNQQVIKSQFIVLFINFVLIFYFAVTIIMICSLIALPREDEQPEFYILNPVLKLSAIPLFHINWRLL